MRDKEPLNETLVITRIMRMLERLDQRAQKRVIQYIVDRLDTSPIITKAMGDVDVPQR